MNPVVMSPYIMCFFLVEVFVFSPKKPSVALGDRSHSWAGGLSASGGQQKAKAKGSKEELLSVPRLQVTS